MSECLFPWVTLNFPWLLWSAYLVLPQMPILTYSSLAFHVSTVNISYWTYGYLSRSGMWTFGGLLTSLFLKSSFLGTDLSWAHKVQIGSWDRDARLRLIKNLLQSVKNHWALSWNYYSLSHRDAVIYNLLIDKSV